MATKRTHRVLGALLRREHRALQREYSVRCVDERTIQLEAIELPSGWTPTEITVRIDIPTEYPRAAPHWRFPGIIRYQGRVPRHLLTSGQWLVRGTLGDPFIWWPATWNPHRSTIRGTTDQALADLLTLDERETEETDA